MRRLLMSGAFLVMTTALVPAQALRNVPRVGIDELKALMASGGVVVVDVRTAEEFAAGRIPGALNIHYTRAAAEAARLKGETRPIVAYCACSNEMTAARAAVDLAAAGVPGVKALKGGWNDWLARGETVEK